MEFLNPDIFFHSNSSAVTCLGCCKSRIHPNCFIPYNMYIYKYLLVFNCTKFFVLVNLVVLPLDTPTWLVINWRYKNSVLLFAEGCCNQKLETKQHSTLQYLLGALVLMCVYRLLMTVTTKLYPRGKHRDAGQQLHPSVMKD